MTAESMAIMERILIIQTAFIGDAILTLPMLQKLREIHPAATLDVITSPLTESIFSSSPYVNETILLDKKNEHKSFLSIVNFTKKIRKKNYTRLYSPHRSIRTSLIVLLSDIKESYGFDNSGLKHVYKYLIPYNYMVHEVQRNLDLIGFQYDEESWKIKPELEINSVVKENVSNFIKDNNLGTNIIAIAPGSIWNTKQYPPEYYKKVISSLVSKNYRIILLGGEKDKPICAQLQSGFKDVITAAGKFSLLESIELLKSVNLLISNDSAPTHMGMCANIPVLTLYCSTSFSFGFFPYNEKSSYLSYDDLFCKPCGIHGYDECPLGTFDCGKLLKPEIVISKIENILND